MDLALEGVEVSVSRVELGLDRASCVHGGRGSDAEGGDAGSRLLTGMVGVARGRRVSGSGGRVAVVSLVSPHCARSISSAVVAA
jgi:hypothetical protein